MNDFSLANSLAHLSQPDSRAFLEKELKAWPGLLDWLQQHLTRGSHALDDELKVVILRQEQTGNECMLHLGLFYTSIIAGCSCADDPTPVETEPEYCELALRVERNSGQARLAQQS